MTQAELDGRTKELCLTIEKVAEMSDWESLAVYFKQRLKELEAING
jgi:hypothetical protein